MTGWEWVLLVVGLLVIIGAVVAGPDMVRYMKIKNM
jgi:hypothetical protein